MNTVEQLNAMVDFVEAHIAEEIDMDVLAKRVWLSAYDAQRMFRFIAGMTLAEYIRKRRLTLAGQELRHKGVKVVDTALKYGYNSPISFARAFQSFHGFNPGEAKKTALPLQSFSKHVFQISVTEVMDMIKLDKITVNGKTYDAPYYGEMDMSTWSEVYQKREYWRLENAYEDFKDAFHKTKLLPCNNFPPMDIQTGQVFVVDYRKKDGSAVERRYYISEGEVWQGMECATEVALNCDPLCTEILTLQGKAYTAEYYGEMDMTWSAVYQRRRYWRLQNAYEDFKDKPRLGEVLPYNNYPPIKFALGQVFFLEYTAKDGKIEHKYYITDGTIWNEMECTREIMVEK